MSGKRAMFPLWLRAWHWTNAVLFLGLIVTGFMLHYATTGGYFRAAVIGHNVLGIGCTLTYLYYLGMIAVTGHWRQFLPRRPFVGRMIRQVLYYLQDIFRGGHHPFPATLEGRFNPLQQIAYVKAIFVLFPVQIVTGLALLFPLYVPERILGFPGLLPVAVAHSVAAYAFTLFLIVHVYLALTVAEAHTGIKAMVLGDQAEPPSHLEHPGHGHPHEAPEAAAAAVEAPVRER